MAMTIGENRIKLARPSGQGISTGRAVTEMRMASNAQSAALERLGKAFGAMAGVVADNKMRANKMAAAKAADEIFMEADKAFYEELETRKENMPVGGDGFAAGFGQYSENWVAGKVAAYEKEHGEEAAFALGRKLESMAWTNFRQASQLERNERVRVRVEGTREAYRMFGQRALDDPEMAPAYYQNGLEVIEEQDLPPDVKDMLRDEFGKEYAHGQANAALNNAPDVMGTILSDPNVREHLTPSQIESYEGRAKAKIEAQEREARAEARAAEARASAERQALVKQLEYETERATYVLGRGKNYEGEEDLKARLIDQAEQMRGTPEGERAALSLKELELAQSDKEAAQQFALTPPEQQDEQLAAMRAEADTPEEFRTLDRLAEIDKETTANFEESFTIIEDAVDEAIGVMDKGYQYARTDELRSALDDWSAYYGDTEEGVAVREQIARLDSAIAVRDAASAFATDLTETDQDAVVTDLKRGGQTAASLDQIDRYESIRKEAQKAFDDGRGLDYALSVGFVDELPPVYFTDPPPDPNAGPDAPPPPTAAESIAARAAIADSVGAQFQRDGVMPFRQSELAAMQRHLDSIEAPSQKLEFLAGLAEGLPDDQYGAVLGAISGKDQTLGFAAEMIRANPNSASASTVAEDIVAGQRILNEGSGYDEPTGREMRAALHGKLGGAYANSPALEKQITEAAMALYAQRMSRDGKLHKEFNAGEFEKAIDAVTGGTITWAGKKIPPPAYGMTKTEFRAALADLPPDMPKMYGRNGDELEEIPLSILGEDGSPRASWNPGDWIPGGDYVEFEPVGDGRYLVLIGGDHTAYTADREPYILDIGAILRRGR